MSVEQAIGNAAANVEIEGFVIDEEYKKLCCKLLNNEITMNDYIRIVCENNGVV